MPAVNIPAFIEIRAWCQTIIKIHLMTGFRFTLIILSAITDSNAAIAVRTFKTDFKKRFEAIYKIQPKGSLGLE
jgi:hypothetical protein